MKSLQQPDLLAVQHPCRAAVQKGRDHNCTVNLDLCGEAEGVVLPNSLVQASKSAARPGKSVVKVFVNGGIVGNKI